MYLNRHIMGLMVSVMLANHASFAADTTYEYMQVPHCLATKIVSAHDVLAENKQFSIIKLAASDVDALSLLADSLKCGRFVNVSHKLSGTSQESKKNYAQDLLDNPPLHLHTAVEYDIQHQETVNAALKEIIPDNIWQTVSHMVSYYNRSATQKTGVETAYWLKERADAMAKEYGRTDITTYFVKTGSYKQPSLVMVVGKEIKTPGVVIGAHIDTLDGFMPGAGDDASGSSSIMEAARALLASKTPLKHPVYFIWYAAEERGLVGSQYVVSHFLKKSIPVKAVIQFDMTGYRSDPGDPAMWVYTDYTDGRLNRFVANLIDTYVHVPVKYSSCGYGCSDHASWMEEGIPASFPCESNFEEHNPYIHSEFDTMDLLSLEHMTNFSKLALAFAIELAA